MTWLVQHSGLIITHPFLTQLFTTLNYLSENHTFKSSEYRERAVHLLHFMATGENSPVAETELVIPKILCGMNTHDPISLDITLTNEEMDCANELLMALIDKWVNLGQASVEGLRETFLWRDASLEAKNDTYQLTMDHRQFDMLLDTLPWEINMVQFPWTEKVIHVSWR